MGNKALEVVGVIAYHYIRSYIAEAKLQAFITVCGRPGWRCSEKDSLHE